MVYIMYTYIYIYIFLSRTKVCSRPLFQNRAVYISLQINLVINLFKGDECDLWSTTQVETS